MPTRNNGKNPILHGDFSTAMSVITRFITCSKDWSFPATAMLVITRLGIQWWLVLAMPFFSGNLLLGPTKTARWWCVHAACSTAPCPPIWRHIWRNWRQPHRICSGKKHMMFFFWRKRVQPRFVADLWFKDCRIQLAHGDIYCWNISVFLHGDDPIKMVPP